MAPRRPRRLLPKRSNDGGGVGGILATLSTNKDSISTPPRMLIVSKDETNKSSRSSSSCESKENLSALSESVSSSTSGISSDSSSGDERENDTGTEHESEEEDDDENEAEEDSDESAADNFHVNECSWASGPLMLSDNEEEGESDYDPEEEELEESDLEADDADDEEIRPARRNKTLPHSIEASKEGTLLKNVLGSTNRYKHDDDDSKKNDREIGEDDDDSVLVVDDTDDDDELHFARRKHKTATAPPIVVDKSDDSEPSWKNFLSTPTAATKSANHRSHRDLSTYATDLLDASDDDVTVLIDADQDNADMSRDDVIAPKEGNHINFTLQQHEEPRNSTATIRPVTGATNVSGVLCDEETPMHEWQDVIVTVVCDDYDSDDDDDSVEEILAEIVDDSDDDECAQTATETTPNQVREEIIPALASTTEERCVHLEILENETMRKHDACPAECESITSNDSNLEALTNNVGNVRAHSSGEAMDSGAVIDHPSRDVHVAEHPAEPLQGPFSTSVSKSDKIFDAGVSAVAENLRTLLLDQDDLTKDAACKDESTLAMRDAGDALVAAAEVAAANLDLNVFSVKTCTSGARNKVVTLTEKEALLDRPLKTAANGDATTEHFAGASKTKRFMNDSLFDTVNSSNNKECKNSKDAAIDPGAVNNRTTGVEQLATIQMQRSLSIDDKSVVCKMEISPVVRRMTTTEKAALVRLMVPNVDSDADFSEDDETFFYSSTAVCNKVHADSRPQKFRREGSVKRGKWKLGSKIGSGAFGVVHVGMNTHTGTLMAVKSLKMEHSIMKDAQREIQLLRMLHHENIVRYYGAEMDSKYLRIFQEWVPAGCLTAMLSKFGPFPLTVLRNYLAQILEGLTYLHANNIMHRDIKGSNILVSDEGIVKLADFGASKRFTQLKGDMMMSLTMRGTPYFMAPEVFEEKYSTKADVWSVACVAVQMATGSPPWKKLGLTNPVSLFQHISNATGPPDMEMNEVEAVSGVVDGRHKLDLFKNLVAICFERVPENRPSAKNLLDHFFFVVDHSLSIDEKSECCGLFSPESTCSKISPSSPLGINFSPIRLPVRRRNSIGAPSSPFFSPPLPRSSQKRASRPLLSPVPDASEWPTWAREKLISAENRQSLAKPVVQALTILEGKPVIQASTEHDDKPVFQAPIMLDSLAYSEDSSSAKRSTSSHFPRTSSISPIGLAFLSNPSMSIKGRTKR